MNDSQLSDYIKSQLQNGLTKEQIYAYLISKGLDTHQIDESFILLEGPDLETNTTISKAKTNLQTLKLAKKTKTPLKKTLIISAITLLSIIAVIGGSLFVYFNYFPSPEIVLLRSFENINKISAVQYTGEITLKGKINSTTEIDNIASSLPTYDGSTSIVFKGGYDKIESNNLKSFLDLSIKLNTSLQEKLEGKIESKIIKNDIFAAVIEGPKEIDMVKNKWVKLSFDEVNKNEQSQSFQENFKIATNERKVTPEQRKKLDNQMIKVARISKVYQDDKINNVEAYHYEYEIIPEELLYYALLQLEISEGRSTTQENLAEIKKNSKDLKPITGEIWIGKKAFNLYKLTSHFEFSKNINNYGSADFNILLNNYNTALKLDAPVKSQTPQEIIFDLFPQVNTSLGTNNPKESDSDNDGLSDYDEILYNTNPRSPDSDIDGYLDGDEVKNGYNPNGEGKLLNQICSDISCPSINTVN
jgi:hypothetical protein